MFALASSDLQAHRRQKHGVLTAFGAVLSGVHRQATRRAIRLGYLISIAIACCPRASFETGQKTASFSFWSTRFLIRIEFNSNFFSPSMNFAYGVQDDRLVLFVVTGILKRLGNDAVQGSPWSKLRTRKVGETAETANCDQNTPK